MEEVEIEFNK